MTVTTVVVSAVVVVVVVVVVFVIVTVRLGQDGLRHAPRPRRHQTSRRLEPSR